MQPPGSLQQGTGQLLSPPEPGLGAAVLAGRGRAACTALPWLTVIARCEGCLLLTRRLGGQQSLVLGLQPYMTILCP